MSPFLAARISRTPRQVTAYGATLASSNAIGNQTQLAYVVAGGTSGLKLPNVGGDAGCLLGDDITVANFLSATITVYASNSATISGYGVSASGNTGVAIATNNSAIFFPVTTTSWMVVFGGSA